MSSENDLEVFSIRVPKWLGTTIQVLAKEGRRSRNGQIVLLLEQAVDLNKTRAAATQEQKDSMVTLKS